MNGAPQPSWMIPTLIVGSIVFCGALGWIILRGYRWLKRSAQASQRHAFEGVRVHSGPMPGLVVVVFHTYYGFLAFVIETKHRFWAPPEDAREALWQLHRFNLRWGMFAYGALLIPLVSYCNYLIQKRSIQRQELAMLF